MEREQLILLAPIEPAPGGNGLAMRTELFRTAAARGHDVTTVVVPVATVVDPDAGPAPGVVIVSPEPALARAGVARLLGDPAWRERLGRAQPLPALARAASPGLADAVVASCREARGTSVHVMRAYLAPLGIAVAERLEAARVTLDLDEDDAEFARSLGDPLSAAGYDRVLAGFGPLFDGLCAASAVEARAISSRSGLAVEYVPNAVEYPPSRKSALSPSPRDHVHLLFVGNLTYPPNIEAARILVLEILPRVERRLGRPVRVTVAGRHHRGLRALARSGVELAGFVPDLGASYDTADVVVVPLAAGAGTRIKLLEAFAHRVPVVCSSTAAAGLEVTDGHQLVLADTPDEAAAAIETIIETPALAEELVAEAERLVRARYSLGVVVPAVEGFLARAAARAGANDQLSVSP